MTHTHHLPGNDFSENNRTEEIELKEGEFICDVCDGTGEYPPKSKYSYWPRQICPKCQGEKKLDWVSIATGVPKKTDPQHFHGTSSGCGSLNTSKLSINSSPINGTLDPNKMILDLDAIEIDNKNIKDYIQDIIAEKFAMEIDKRIMEALQNQEEQINKKKEKTF